MTSVRDSQPPPKRCLDCGYMLDNLPDNRCPECGREFDPDDSTSFTFHVREGRPYFYVSVILGIVMLASSAASHALEKTLGPAGAYWSLAFAGLSGMAWLGLFGIHVFCLSELRAKAPFVRERRLLWAATAISGALSVGLALAVFAIMIIRRAMGLPA